MKIQHFIGWIAGILLAVMVFGIGPSQATSTAPASLEKALEKMVPSITIQPPRTYQELTIYPISAGKVKDKTSYMTLDEAGVKGLLRISELGRGQVPKVKAENLGNRKIFIMTGEIITGAKQDRMSAHDVVLGKTRKPVVMPVYCVEQGRWVMKSQRFSAGGTAGTKKLRRSAVKKYKQGEIWSDVAEKSEKASVKNATGTMQAVYNDPKIRKEIAKYVRAFENLPQKTGNMVGFIVVSGGRISNADIFANPMLLEGLWKKLLRASAVDIVTEKETQTQTPSLKQIQGFINDGLAGQFNRIPNPGIGQEFLIEGENGVSGSTLLNGDSVVHMALFSKDKGENPRELRAEYRTSRERRHRTEKQVKQKGSSKKKGKNIRVRTYKDKAREKGK